MSLYETLYEKLSDLVSASTFPIVSSNPQLGEVTTSVSLATPQSIYLGLLSAAFDEASRRAVYGPGTRLVSMTWEMRLVFASPIDPTAFLLSLEESDSTFVPYSTKYGTPGFRILPSAVTITDPKPTEADLGTRLTLTFTTQPSDL